MQMQKIIRVFFSTSALTSSTAAVRRFHHLFIFVESYEGGLTGHDISGRAKHCDE